MGLKIIKKLFQSNYKKCSEIPVGTLFSGELIGLDEEFKEYDNNRCYSCCFLKHFSGIIDLEETSNTWNNPKQLKVYNYKELNGTLTIE